MTKVERKRFAIWISIRYSSFGNSSFHSLFTAENEMSVMPASAQAFIAWET